MIYFLSLNIGPTGCPETPVKDCHYLLPDSPEGCSPNFLKFKFEIVFEKIKFLELD
jgi:hypothetical protein